MFFWSLGLLSILYAQNINKNFAWSLSGGIAGLAMAMQMAYDNLEEETKYISELLRLVNLYTPLPLLTASM